MFQNRTQNIAIETVSYIFLQDMNQSLISSLFRSSNKAKHYLYLHRGHFSETDQHDEMWIDIEA